MTTSNHALTTTSSGSGATLVSLLARVLAQWRALGVRATVTDSGDRIAELLSVIQKSGALYQDARVYRKVRVSVMLCTRVFCFFAFKTADDCISIRFFSFLPDLAFCCS